MQILNGTLCIDVDLFFRFDRSCRHRSGRSQALVHSPIVLRQGLGTRLSSHIYQRDTMLGRSAPSQGASAARRGTPYDAHRRAA